ncbi:MAG: right-handed parallel beta-helix repeat-containing protein [Bacillota bacterium]|nr:hypothetical protein [Bacillota bacterium]HPQ10184.1 right-handed parallel beta-helix repeat-containing protein [Bacillota bacterium]
MKRKRILTLGLVVVLAAFTFASSVEIAGTIDETNNIWGPEGSGALIAAETIVLTGDIVVPQGIILTIMPGARIVAQNVQNPNLSQNNLFSGLEIAVHGKVAAFGTKEQPISFSGKLSEPGSWQGFFTLGSLTLQNVIITDAECAVTASDGSLQISSCTFRGNNTAVRLWGWQNAKIQQSLIENNIDGISCSSTPATIQGNTIKDNNVGIRILLGESVPVITENTFLSNREYHIYNLSVLDVKAYPNTWDVPLELLYEKIFDGRVEPEAGLVIVEP